MRMRAVVVLLLVLAFTVRAPAAKYAGEFLEIGVGARAVGMGGAVTAHADDPMAFYWNPAGMSYISGIQAAGMYADLWNGLANYSVAGVSLPVSGAVLSGNWVRLGVPDIQEHPDYDALLRSRQLYTIRDGDTTRYNTVQEYLLATGAAPRGVFSDNESAIFVTFSRLNRVTLDLGWAFFEVPFEIPFGASLKIINQRLGGNSGSGLGADFGAQLRFRLSDVFAEGWKAGLAWGFNYQDATNTAVNWGENNKDAIPPNFRHGFAFTQKLPGKDSRVILSWDTEERWERTHHYGLEYRYADALSLRGGFWGEQWTAGAGISVWRASVDYAYLSRELGSTHRVSVAFKIK